MTMRYDAIGSTHNSSSAHQAHIKLVHPASSCKRGTKLT